MGELGGILDPHLRQRGIERQLARHARGVGVEDVRGDAVLLERIADEMRLRQVGRGVDALQNLTDTVAPRPSCLMPERPDTRWYAKASATRSVTRPFTPTAVVTKLVSGAYAGMS